MLVILTSRLVVVFGRVDELVVDTVIQLCVIINFVLTVLVPTPCREFYHFFLLLHFCHLEDSPKETR